jgi:heme exporter protein CcmD
MTADPYAVHVLAAYGVTLALLALLVLWVVLRGEAAARALSRIEAERREGA